MLHRISMPYDTNVWYHVTDASNLQSIRDHGLVPYNREMSEKVFPEHSVVENGVYLSPTIASAQSFATRHSMGNLQIGEITDPVILKVTNVDMNRLIPDPEAFNVYWNDMTYEIIGKMAAAEDTQDDWENLERDLAENGVPKFIVDNAAMYVSEDMLHDHAGSIWAEIMSRMNLQQRQELSQFWAAWRSDAFVYLGAIPAQNISIASYGLYGEEPSEADIMAYYDDHEDEFSQNYRFQPMFSKSRKISPTPDLHRRHN